MKMILNGMQIGFMDDYYALKVKKTINLFQNADEFAAHFLVAPTGFSV